MRIPTFGPIAVAVAAITAAQQPSPAPPNCRPSGELVRVGELAEASGIAASRRSPGMFWAHNDSGDPMLFALDGQGRITGRIRVTGASVDDWEDLAVGPCPQGTCIYIGDIGDNDGKRKHVTIYRVPEPASGDKATAPAEAFNAAYPGGPHDAESLFVTPDGDVFIVTKGDPGAVAIYRVPRQLASDRIMPLQRVAERPAGKKVDSADRPTAADISPDGRLVAVRTTKWVAFYAAADLTAGRWREVARTDLTPLDEPRGEGLTFADATTLVLAGEGGNRLLRRPGTFARLTCGSKSEAPGGERVLVGRQPPVTLSGKRGADPEDR